jgi:hypothetical protein
METSVEAVVERVQRQALGAPITAAPGAPVPVAAADLADPAPRGAE